MYPACINLHRYHGYHGILLFLLLCATAMVQMYTFICVLPLLFFVVVAYTLPVLKSATGYLAVALTICKIE